MMVSGLPGSRFGTVRTVGLRLIVKGYNFIVLIDYLRSWTHY